MLAKYFDHIQHCAYIFPLRGMFCSTATGLKFHSGSFVPVLLRNKTQQLWSISGCIYAQLNFPNQWNPYDTGRKKKRFVRLCDPAYIASRPGFWSIFVNSACFVLFMSCPKGKKTLWCFLYGQLVFTVVWSGMQEGEQLHLSGFVLVIHVFCGDIECSQ